MVRALRERHETRLWAARIVDRRGVFGEPIAARAVGVPGWPSWLAPYREITEVFAARRIARRVLEDAHQGWRPDLILERHALFSDAGWRLHDRLAIPWVLEVNAPLREERQRFEVLRQPEHAARWERDVLQAAPRIVAVSQWLVRWLQEEMGCTNVHWLPNGVDAHLGDRLRGRALLGVESDEPVIGFVGSMKPWHGFERLAAIADAVGARLALIGPRPKNPPAGAILTGHLIASTLADAIAGLDVGLAPYPADAPPWFCPLKVLAYRAQGTPVVATDVGDCRILVGEDGGSVVPADSDEALIEATRAWLGKRTQPTLRSWADVRDQLLAITRRTPRAPSPTPPTG